MFAQIIEGMLPPGVTMEKIMETGQQIAAQMMETAHTIQRVEKLLLEVKEMLVERQGTTVLSTVKESNHDAGQYATGQSDQSYTLLGTASATGSSGGGIAFPGPCPGCGTRTIGPCPESKCSGYDGTY